MIVRINQIDPATAESVAGWDRGNLRGPIESYWPHRTFAYQILVLEQDEAQHPLPVQFRQKQIRQLIPHILTALSKESDHLVLRFDGLFAKDELLSVFEIIADEEKVDRYAYTANEKMYDDISSPITSVRLLAFASTMPGLLADETVGLERSVRLRVFAVPESLVNPLLDTADIDDERWREIIPAVSFVLSTGIELSSLVIWTTHFNPADAKQRIMDQLGGKKRDE